MMKLKKLVAISDFFPNCVTPRKKIVSGFGLGFVLFFIFIFLLVCNFSFKNPNSDKLYFQGFNISNSKNSSIIAWSYSISTTSSFIENATLLEQNPKIVVSESRVESNGSSLDIKLKFKGIDEKGNTHFGNFTGDGKNRSFNGVSSKILDFDDTRLMKLSNDGKNESLIANFAKILEIEDTHLMKFKNDGKNGSFNGVSSKILDFEDTHLMKVKNDVKNGSFSANSVKILDIEDTYLMKVKDVKNGSFSAITMNPNEGKVIFGQVVGNRSVKSDGLDRNSDSRNKKDEIGDGKISQILRNYSSTFEECDIFDGRWVRDDTKPYYPAGSCPFVDKDLNCHRHGRPDNEFVKWRWQPFGCEIPSLNATDFLERLRGKKMVFVGDSLNRNMWESLVCILRHSLKNKNRFYEISGKREFKKKGIYAFRFEDYNCTVDFVASPFLVRESSFKGKNGTFETLRLDLMDRATSMYQDADMLIFNTGHWWTHEKTSRGKDYYQEGNHVYPRLKALDAYSRALSTWAKWVDKNIDTRKTQVIFRGYSVTHFRGGRWDSGGQCHKETEPIYNTTHLTKYPSKMRAFENVMHVMKTPMIYLNISRLTDYRKDGHPSIYRSVSLKQQIVAEHSQDCSHWCLPGVPDTWNELLYASLLKIGRGSWKS